MLLTQALVMQCSDAVHLPSRHIHHRTGPCTGFMYLEHTFEGFASFPISKVFKKRR